MKIENAALLAQMREPGNCEYCRKWCRRRAGHHFFLTRGAGGSDVTWNLISLGDPNYWTCTCHQDIHDGRILREDVLAVVAAREGVLQSEIESFNYWLLRAPKWSDIEASFYREAS